MSSALLWWLVRLGAIARAAAPDPGATLVPQTGHLGPVNAVDLSGDGRRAVTAGEDGVALVWDAEASALLRRLEGHTDAVVAARFSPDGRAILTASRDDSAAIWDPRTGERLHELIGHRGDVVAASWSPDGRRVVTASDDDTAIVWDPATGALLHRLPHADDVGSAAFSADGTRLLTTSADDTAAVWDAASGQRLHALSGHTGDVHGGAFSADGRRVVTASADGTAIVWDTLRGTAVRALAGHSGPVLSATFSSDGRKVATASADHTSAVWSADSGKRRLRIEERGEVLSSGFSPDGALLLTVSEGVATLWDARTGTRREELNEALFRVRAAAFSADGRSVVGATWLSSAFVWNVSQWEPTSWLRGWVVGVPSVAFSPDGALLAAGGAAHLWDLGGDPPLAEVSTPGASWEVAFSSDGAKLAASGGEQGITWWDLSSAVRHTLAGHSGEVSSVAWSPDGAWLASAGNDRTVRVWDVATDRERFRLEGHEKRVSQVVWSPDGRRLASAGDDGVVFLWDPATGQRARELRGHRAKVMSVAFSPDGGRILSASWDGTAILWDAGTGAQLRVFEAAGPVHATVFSPDGARIATVSSRGTTELWSAATGLRAASLGGHVGQVGAVAFSPDGSHLVTGGFDHDAIIWSVDSTEPVHRLSGHLGRVFSVAYAPDGRWIATGSLDGSTRLWDAATGAPVAALTRANGQWAVTDPEGRFDADRDGDVLGLAWVIGDQPYDLLQLMPEYYDPGLLAKRLGRGAEPLREVPPLDSVAPPPRLIATGPTPAGRLTLRAEDRGGGVGAVFVRLNGSDVSEAIACPDLESGCTVELAALPTWLPGAQNRVEARIQGAATAVRSRGLDVAARAGGQPLQDPPDLWVAAIGTSDYAGDALDLRFAANDAVRFADALRLAGVTGFGLDRTHVRVWSTTDDPPGVGTLAEIVAWLGDADPSDTLVLFLSGHGAALTTDTVEDYFYLLPSATGFSDLADPALRVTRAWSGQQLASALAATAPLKRLVVLDTCAAGKVGDLPLAESRGLPSDMIRAHARAHERTGAWLVAGAAADQPSYEASRYGQGVLTYTLLEGMKGPALGDDAQILTVAHLADWAERSVPEHAAGIGGVQRPVIRRGAAEDFPLGRLSPADVLAIPLQKPLPVVVSARVVPFGGRPDLLGVEAAINAALREAAASGQGAFVVWSTAPIEDSWQITGQYTERGRAVKFDGYLSRLNGADTEQTELHAAGSDAATLASAVVEQVLGLVR